MRSNIQQEKNYGAEPHETYSQVFKAHCHESNVSAAESVYSSAGVRINGSSVRNDKGVRAEAVSGAPSSIGVSSGGRSSMFSTAGGAGVHLSESALARGRSFIAGVESGDDTHTRSESSASKRSRPTGYGDSRDSHVIVGAMESASASTAAGGAVLDGSSVGNDKGVRAEAVSGAQSSITKSVGCLCDRDDARLLDWVRGLGSVDMITKNHLLYCLHADIGINFWSGVDMFNMSHENDRDPIVQQYDFLSTFKCRGSSGAGAKLYFLNLLQKRRRQFRLDLWNSISSQNVSKVVFLTSCQASVCSVCASGHGGSIQPLEWESAFDSLCSMYFPQGLPADQSEWVRNQLKWVVWTLLSYERSYPRKYLGKLVSCCSIRKAICKRYRMWTSRSRDGLANEVGTDRSIQRGRPVSALKDCIGTGAVVLPFVVCLLLSRNSQSQAECCVSDGWWCCTAKMDKLLEDLIDKVSCDCTV